jgi:hypothetical protein
MPGDGGVGPRELRSPGLCQYDAALRRAALLACPPDETNGEAPWLGPFTVSTACSKEGVNAGLISYGCPRSCWLSGNAAEHDGQRTAHDARAALQPLRHHPVPLPDAVKPGIHCARTHWIRGFMTFRLVRRTRIVTLMMPV